MSSGIEIFLLAPVLLPALAGGSTTAAGVAGGSVAASGGSIVTTGAFASGSAVSASSTAAVGGAVAAAGTAIFVAGAAGAALLAAQSLQTSYQSALAEYQQRLEHEKGAAAANQIADTNAENSAITRVRNASIQASESAEWAFLRAGALRLQKRVNGLPDIDPRLPDGCAKLLALIDSPAPNFAALFTSYQKLSEYIRRAIAKSASSNASVLAVQSEISELEEEVAAASSEILAKKTRHKFVAQLQQLRELAQAQPQMATQGLDLLRQQIHRELFDAAQRQADHHAAQEKRAAQLRTLAGHIAARSQATLAVLKNDELTADTLATPALEKLRARAMHQLSRLAALLSGEVSDDFAPLKVLFKEADQLFDQTAAELRDLAQQIYLREQVMDVFTELGYRVTSVDNEEENTPVVAALDKETGVEVRIDGQGRVNSEMVALSAAAAEANAGSEEKVCALMDDVFDRLRARGCIVREKKRHHFGKKAHRLKVVQMPQKTEHPFFDKTPIARHVEEE